jgi:hypothetical protein
MLIEHPVLLVLSKDLRTYLLKLLTQATGSNVQIEVSPAEVRAHSIYSRVAELDNCLRSLRMAIAGLQIEATSSAPDIEQYRYHTENYLLRLTGIYDRACRFVGIAIGMSSQQVDQQSGNSHVKKQLQAIGANCVTAVLAELKSLLEPHWDSRNLVAHAGEFSSRELGLFSTVSQVKSEFANPEELHSLMTHHFRDGALDFGLLALQVEGLLYRLIEELAPRVNANQTDPNVGTSGSSVAESSARPGAKLKFNTMSSSSISAPVTSLTVGSTRTSMLRIDAG